jgi:hypothetical protein
MARAQENQSGEPTTSAPQASAKPDLVGEIGTLTYARAVKAFGKDKALEVLHKVAQIGGHGMFDDNDFLSPLFGGLQMPSASVVIAPNKDDFAGLPDGDFHYEQAMERYGEQQAAAEKNRSAINDLYIAYQGMR